MLKQELEVKVKEQQKELENLKKTILKYCEQAIDLDPCEGGLEIIDNIRKDAGLPDRIITVNLDITLNIPARFSKTFQYANIKIMVDGVFIDEVAEINSVDIVD